MKTVLLTRPEVELLLHLPALLPQMRQAFQAYSLQRSIPAQRVVTTETTERRSGWAFDAF